ncbi:hypothetical protein BU24DRAFT_429047 [Aaosphaeria arxii CBS 175.79]|uniref:Rhodopsin domain-containing protein n=1 Tax=Aaosphaeria arxii CBS 175.79 TaxID=1450172 RepID=A0A6A5X853_9PLEO|nr:uncharacterized protein BU24DRAFT_429047 [Aaosphaeria arxii CBS 175.79]KAF2009122.1 hypothetical protein BU24DRAFT_429047 [Aaosphaeria arxii CBS 175.79]
MDAQAAKAAIVQKEALDVFIVQATAASWPFFILATLVFCMRTVSRIRFTEAKLGIEDIIISLSYFCDVVRMVTFQLALTYTKKVTIPTIAETSPDATFWGLFTCSWAFISCTLPKVGVAILLIRIFNPPKSARTAILVCVNIFFLYCFVGFFICFVQCTPMAGQWNPFKYPETKCWPRNVQMIYALVGSSSSALLDFLFALYPGYMIWGLKMPLWKKISTICFMSLGFLAFAFATVKVVNNGSLLGNPTIVELFTKVIHIGLWNSLENDFIIIAACLPSTRPLFRRCNTIAKTHLTASRPTRMNSDSESHNSFALKKPEPLEITDPRWHEGKLEPTHTMNSIYVRHDVIVERPDPWGTSKQSV